MSKSKAQSYGELQTLLENEGLEGILLILSNFMSANEMERFVEHVKDEQGSNQDYDENNESNN